MEQNVKKIAGVSLIEVMIGMLLVAIALFTIVAIFPRMTGHRKSIHEADQARMIAMEALEGLQALSAERINEGKNSCDITALGEYNTFLGENYKILPLGATAYTVDQLTLSKTSLCCGDSDCPSPGINTVDLRIHWNKAGKTHHTRVMGVIR